MTCCEMFLISVVFLWTFTAEPYLQLRESMPRVKGIWGALVDVFDFRDILYGCWYVVKIVFGLAGNEGIEDGRGDEAGVEMKGEGRGSDEA